MRYQPSSWLDQLVGAAAGLLVAAAAIYVAVRLIEAIWIPLLVITVSVLVIAGLVTIIRWRRQGW